VVSVESPIHGVSADGKNFLHVRYAILKDQSLSVFGHIADTAGWSETVNIAIEEFQVEEILKSQRKSLWEGLRPLTHLLAHLPDVRGRIL
jgi:hypothetical protein